MIGFDRETRIIDELETAQLVEQVQRALRDDEISDAAILELAAISPDCAMKLSREMFALIKTVRGLGRSPRELRDLILRTLYFVAENPQAKLRQTWENEQQGHKEAGRIFNATYAEYGRRLSERKLLDFDGVLIAARDALTGNELFQRRIRQNFEYIIVDEFQDTNRVQLEFLEALARPAAANLEVVGDPRQSIYGWRDAAISNIVDFPSNLGIKGATDPGDGPIKLVENYRSDQAILDAAAVVLARDSDLCVFRA